MWNVGAPLSFSDINKNKKVMEWSYYTPKSRHKRVVEFFGVCYLLRGFGGTFLNFLTQNLDLRDKTCYLSYMLPSFSQHNSFLSLTRFQFLLVNYKILIQDSRMFQERLTVDMRIPDKAIVFCRCTASCVKLLGLQCQTKGSANVL